jgi:uncharacterized integral membrane protein (TIGR00697 family)
LVYLSAAYGAAVLAANYLASLALLEARLGPLYLVFPAGTVAYAATFLITDAVSEVYGKAVAYRVVRAGVLAYLLGLLLAATAALLPAVDEESGRVLDRLATMNARVIAGGLLAYLVSQHHDVWAFHLWRRLTRWRHLWLRNNASTTVSQLIDTTVFVLVAFYGATPSHLIPPMIISTYTIKVIVAILDTPIVYALTWIIRRTSSTNLSPPRQPPTTRL